MRSLITGISGFAGGHLAGALIERGAEVAGIDRTTGKQLEPLIDRISFTAGDVRDVDTVRSAIGAAAPDTVFHLAAITHVGEAWTQRRETIEVNVVGTSAVLEAAAECDPKPTVVLASSGQVYGPGDPDGRPLCETDPVSPRSPYAVSKACAELLAQQAWAGEELPTVIVRTFNYTGPWQAPTFVASDFARQVAWAEAGLSPPRIAVGNLEARRDFSDVRDIVAGYLLAAESGRPGEAYNLASGAAVRIGDLLEALRGASAVDIEVAADEERLRPIDLPVLCGDAGRAREELGWKPRYDLDATLETVLAFWRQQAAQED